MGDPGPPNRYKVLVLGCTLATLWIVGSWWSIPSGGDTLPSAPATPVSPPATQTPRLIVLTAEVAVTRWATVVQTVVIERNLSTTQTAIAGTWGAERTRTALTPVPTRTATATRTPVFASDTRGGGDDG